MVLCGSGQNWRGWQIGLDHRDAIRRQPSKNFCLLPRDAVNIIKGLQMCDRNRRYDGNIGSHHKRQRCYFAGMVHADLEHRKFGICRHAGQCQWDPPMIVIAGHRSMGAPLSSQHLAQHLFGRGFANRAGDRHNPRVTSGAGRTAQCLKRHLNIRHDKQRCIIGNAFWAPRHQGRSGTVVKSLRDKIMTVPRCLQSDKQIPLLQTAAVNRNPVYKPVALGAAPGGGHELCCGP